MAECKLKWCFDEIKMYLKKVESQVLRGIVIA